MSQIRGFPRGFWWLWTSTLVNRLGTFVLPFLTIYLTTQRGYSATHAGLVVAVYGVGGSLGALLGGDLTDRIGRRPTMAAGQTVTALATMALGLATGAIAIAAATFVIGVAAGAVRPAVGAMIADIVEPQDRVRAYAVNYWAINIGFAFSAAVAGFLAREGYIWLFFGDAATTLICAAVIWFRLPETRPADARETAAIPETRASFRPVLRDGRFLLLCLLGFAMEMLFFQGASSLPITMTRHGISPAAYGLVIALNGLIIVLLQIPLTSVLKRRHRGVVLVLSALVAAVGFGSTGFGGTSAILYAGSVVLWTLGEIAYNPAASASVAELARSHTRGHYQGVFALGPSVAAFLGPIAGGIVLDRWHGPALWLGCAALGLAVAAGFRALSPSLGSVAHARGDSADDQPRQQDVSSTTQGNNQLP